MATLNEFVPLTTLRTEWSLYFFLNLIIMWTRRSNKQCKQYVQRVDRNSKEGREEKTQLAASRHTLPHPV